MDPVHLFASNENHPFSVFSLALPEPLTHLHILSSSPHCPNAFFVSSPDSPWENRQSPCQFYAFFSRAHNLQLGAFQQPAAGSLSWPRVLACPHRVLLPHLRTCSFFFSHFPSSSGCPSSWRFSFCPGFPSTSGFSSSSDFPSSSYLLSLLAFPHYPAFLPFHCRVFPC
uniref:Uncharacterized protein n=1 Tax=Molossus molossus TaxID=27622 RepID=A0A7J8J6A7_MOLMO|nr:hypothetical protein HJG59_009589 [Molossus molossus]